MRLMIINGSVREGRKSDFVQNWVEKHLQSDAELELDVVDLREVNLPFYNEPVSPAMPNVVFKNATGNAWGDRVARADAFIFFVAEYNHGPTAVLKNAIDWVYHGWLNKPVGLISYGGMVGGSRAAEQLKQIVLHVQLFPVPTTIHIPGIGTAFDEAGNPVHHSLNSQLDKQIEELKSFESKLKS